MTSHSRPVSKVWESHTDMLIRELDTAWADQKYAVYADHCLCNSELAALVNKAWLSDGVIRSCKERRGQMTWWMIDSASFEITQVKITQVKAIDEVLDNADHECCDRTTARHPNLTGYTSSQESSTFESKQKGNPIDPASWQRHPNPNPFSRRETILPCIVILLGFRCNIAARTNSRRASPNPWDGRWALRLPSTMLQSKHAL